MLHRTADPCSRTRANLGASTHTCISNFCQVGQLCSFNILVSRVRLLQSCHPSFKFLAFPRRNASGVNFNDLLTESKWSQDRRKILFLICSFSCFWDAWKLYQFHCHCLEPRLLPSVVECLLSQELVLQSLFLYLPSGSFWLVIASFLRICGKREVVVTGR